jgi:flavin reductase (DIM6/NTAB) family NADH-FMN oxidoreductase RutF
MPSVADGFPALVADLEYPMAVVTCDDGRQRSGCLVGFLSQCSIDPPRMTVWISITNHTHPVALASDHLAVHLLSSAERGVAELFGSRTGDEVDKFSRCAWHPGPGGAPVLEDCTRWFVARVLDHHADGDHTGFLLEPVELGPTDAPWTGQLGFQAVRDLDPGHDP